MAISVKQLVRRHGAPPAAVTALGVAVAIVVLRMLEEFVSWVTVAQYVADAATGVNGLQQSGYAVGAIVASALLSAVPFAIGYFLSLWLVAPIAEELRVGHVVTRAVLATGIGATLVFVVLAVLAITGAFTFGGSLFGNSFPFPAFDGASAVTRLGSALAGGLMTLLHLLPLGVLGGVLLWIWRKDHPPRHPLSGLIDEV